MNKDLKEVLKGVGTALVTPMLNDGAIDFDGLKKLIKDQHDGKIDFLVVQGTTGESATISTEEKQQILDCIIEYNAGKLPIVFGIGGNNTQSVCDAFSSFNLDGVDAILSASPSYNKPTQAGIIAHFTAVADASPLPIILYNVPGRTASNMLASTTLTLANHDNIIAVKEASGDLMQIMEISKNKPENFILLSGDDALTLPIISIGGSGVISVVSNVAPAIFVSMVHAGLEGDYTLAKNLQFKLLDLMNALFEEGNPGGAKAALKIRSICEENMRLPLVEVSEDLKKKLKNILDKLQ